MKATFVSSWDNGDSIFKTSCDFDIETKTVSNIESVDVDDEDLYYVDEEFIELPDGTIIKDFTNADEDTVYIDGEKQD